MTFPFFPYFSGNNIHHPTKSAYDQRVILAASTYRRLIARTTTPCSRPALSIVTSDSPRRV